MLASSAATVTDRAADCAARRATRTIIGSPAMSASGLFGSRVEASRAGIRTSKATPVSRPRSVFGGQGARLALEHHRDAVAHRKSKPVGLADELLALLQRRAPVLE